MLGDYKHKSTFVLDNTSMVQHQCKRQVIPHYFAKALNTDEAQIKPNAKQGASIPIK